MTSMIRKEIEIEAPAEQVWPYIGTQTGLQQWWGAEILLEEKEDGRCEEKGRLDGIPYHRVGKVTIYDPPRQLHLVLQDVTGQAWPSVMSLSLALVEANNRTTVIVVQQVHDQMPGLSPQDLPKPQSAFQPPVLGIGQEGLVASTEQTGGAPRFGSAAMTRGRGSIYDSWSRDETVWKRRLETLRRRACAPLHSF